MDVLSMEDMRSTMPLDHFRERSDSDNMSRGSVETISFTLYMNQVGGHVPLLRSSSGKVCKPLSEKELEFYEFLPHKIPHLVKFTPRFYGLIEVDSSGSVFRRHESEVNKRGGEDGDRLRDLWSWKCQQSCVKNPHRTGLSSIKYIALEDLACGFTNPCILDVKMGRRQFIADATPEKLARQIEKSRSTTSYALGFRLCGLQVYSPSKRQYTFRDKYWGRHVTTDNMVDSMLEFFLNGSRVRYGLIPSFIRRLSELKNAIQTAIGYRFYSSSLLFLYDGGIEEDATCSRYIDIRMIDFAHTIHVSDNHPDLDYIYGLDNLMNTLDSAYQAHKLDLTSPQQSPLVSPSNSRSRTPSLSRYSSSDDPRVSSSSTTSATTIAAAASSSSMSTGSCSTCPSKLAHNECDVSSSSASSSCSSSSSSSAPVNLNSTGNGSPSACSLSSSFSSSSASSSSPVATGGGACVGVSPSSVSSFVDVQPLSKASSSSSVDVVLSEHLPPPQEPAAISPNASGPAVP